MTDISKEAVDRAAESLDRVAKSHSPNDTHPMADMLRAMSARIADLEAQQAHPVCVDIEWGNHPDGVEFYAFPNDDGDALYVVYHHPDDDTDWRVMIGGEFVMQDDPEDGEMYWPTSERAKAFVEEDLKSRMRRVLSAITLKSEAEVRADERAKVLGEVEAICDNEVSECDGPSPYDKAAKNTAQDIGVAVRYLHTRAIAEKDTQ